MNILNLISESTKPKISNFWILFCLLFFSACGEGPPSELPSVDKRFRTTPPSRIYFKNIRSTAYEWNQDPKTRTDFYLLRKIAGTSPRPALYPVIADIWMEDQAHLLLKSGRQDALSTPVIVHWQSATESGTYRLDSLTTEQQYQFGLDLYKAIRGAKVLEISFPGKDRIPLFANPNERSYFMTSMQDYLRLTEYF